MTPGDRVRHVDGWTGTVRAKEVKWHRDEHGLDNGGMEALVHRDDTQRSEWVRVEDLSDADDA